jgi:hypothetical protein
VSGAESPDVLEVTADDVSELLLGERAGDPTPGRSAELRRQPLEADGQRVTQSLARMRWFVHELVEAGAWDQLGQLSTQQWRTAVLDVAGTDAVLLQALDDAAQLALERLDGADAAPAFLAAAVFGACLRDVMSDVPVGAMVASGVVRRPYPAVAEAARRSDSHIALPALVAALVEDGQPGPVRYAFEVASAVPGAFGEYTLARLAPLLVALEPGHPDVVTRAWDVATRITGSWGQREATAGIIHQLVVASEGNPTIVARASELAREIVDESARARSLGEVAERLWPADPSSARDLADEAAAAARAAATPDERCEALAEVAGRVAAGGPSLAGALVAEAIETAKAVPLDVPRIAALAGIAAHVATVDPASAHALAAEAADIAGRITDTMFRAHASATLARRLVAGAVNDPVLLDRAVEVARTIPYDAVQANTLATIAERLIANDVTWVAQAEEVIASISGDADRASALAGLAQQATATEPTHADELVAQAVALASSLDGPAERSRTLGDVAGRVVRTDRALANDLAAQAEALASSLSRERAVGELRAVLTELTAAGHPAGTAAPTVAVGDDQDHGGPAWSGWGVGPGDVTSVVQRSRIRNHALLRVVKCLAAGSFADADLLRRVVPVANKIADEDGRDEALADLVGRFLDAEPDDLPTLHAAADLAHGIVGEQERSTALVRVARALAAADPTDAEIVTRAIDVARRVPLDEVRAQALVVIAQVDAIDPELAQDLVARALGDVEAIVGDRPRSLALAVVGVQIAYTEGRRGVAQLARAVDVARTIADEDDRDDSLCYIAEAAVTPDPADAELTSIALDALGSVVDRHFRDSTIMGITEQVIAADPTDPELLTRAVELAQEVEDLGDRSIVLADIAAQVAAANAGNRDAVIAAAGVAVSIPDIGDRTRTVASIAGQLGDVRLLAEHADWRTRPPDAFTYAVRTFLEHLARHHPEMATRVVPPVARALREAEGLAGGGVT